MTFARTLEETDDCSEPASSPAMLLTCDERQNDGVSQEPGKPHPPPPRSASPADEIYSVDLKLNAPKPIFKPSRPAAIPPAVACPDVKNGGRPKVAFRVPFMHKEAPNPLAENGSSGTKYTRSKSLPSMPTEEISSARRGEIRVSRTRPPPRTIEWGEFSTMQFLRHGTGTSLYIATLCDETVVVKAPKHGMQANATAEITEELKIEEATLRKMNHPGVIRLFGNGFMSMKDGSSLYFFVVEWLGGGTLSDRLNHIITPSNAESNLTIATRAMSAIEFVPSPGTFCLLPPKIPSKMALAEALRIGEELADILRYLHDEADSLEVVLHRDLKPDNIGFLSDGSVCLFDFGLTTTTPRRREDQILDKRLRTPPDEIEACLPRYRMTGHTGSVRYMAPEVALDQPYNQSVDVYSFSIMLWEMVSHKRPYAGMNVKMHRARVCENQERPPIKAAILQTDLALLLQAGWAHGMDERPSFFEIMNVLKKIRANHALAKSKPTFLTSLRGRIFTEGT